MGHNWKCDLARSCFILKSKQLYPWRVFLCQFQVNLLPILILMSKCLYETCIFLNVELTSPLVHNCTIFLLPLDVRNIVQGGDPLDAGFFSYTGLWRLYLTKLSAFFCKKHMPIVWRPEISFFGTTKFHILGPGGSFFRPFHFFKIYWVFSKFTEFIRYLLVDPPIYL